MIEIGLWVQQGRKTNIPTVEIIFKDHVKTETEGRENNQTWTKRTKCNDSLIEKNKTQILDLTH